MSMKKKLFFAAIALTTLAGCTDESYVGDQSLLTNENGGAISFNGGANKITRATANTGAAHVMLDNQFKVYGVKQDRTTTTNYNNVFVNYGVWWDNTKTTTSNSSNWEYVYDNSTAANKGSVDNVMNISNQTIKYWDHSSADYHFVAGSPYNAFTFTLNNTTGDISTATVEGLAGHLNANPTSGEGTAITTNPVYIANPLTIAKGSYSTAHGTAPVTFNFTRQQARVRIGIYETIPGYVIKEIKFYKQDGSLEDTNPHNVILTSGTDHYFRGATNGKATITYDWSTSTPTYTFTYNDAGDGATVTTAKNWYGGTFVSEDPTDPTKPAIKATTSTNSNLWGTDKDMDTNGYFTVIPTPSATTASALLIKCDYTLLSEKDGSGENIIVTGATAAVPAAFSKWNPNTTYTYIFKISDNTNGSTGNNVVGLYPITFDAAVVDETAAQGTITTVSTPSITTYQNGSVTDTGIKYVKDKDIVFTVQSNTDGSLKQLTTTADAVGCVKVYWLGALDSYTIEPTEADMQVTAPNSELTSSNPTGSTALSLPGTALDINGQTIATTYYGTFKPGAAGYYVIQYLNDTTSGNAYAYKIIKVEAS